MVHNDPVDFVDMLGLWATAVHHDIVDRWLPPNPYDKYPWRCCKIPVRSLLKEGSDDIDGVDIYVNWPSAQSSDNAYQHAMRSPKQTVAEAQALYNQFLSDHIQRAKRFADEARRRQNTSCAFIYAAVRELGKAYHAYSDSLSPSHSGFQTWWGPIDGVATFGRYGYLAYLKAHSDGETMQVYQGMQSTVVGAVQGQFQGDLDTILHE